MSRFAATTVSEAVVAADRATVWAAISDPALLPKLTPLLRRIDAEGDLWRWHMVRVAALGVGITPVFTERMRFAPDRRIDFAHEPPTGATERAGAVGWYELSDDPGGTHLGISLTVHVDLPLPGLARPAVNRVMHDLMDRTGNRFATNLLRHLGLTG